MEPTPAALHIGDLHFWRLPKNPLDLAGKRLLGVANLILHRARRFPPHGAAILAARAAELRPERVLFSGDFTTTALASEFDAARETLRPALALARRPARAVPGNHDRYTAASMRSRAFEASLGEWTGGDAWPGIEPLGGGRWLISFDAGARNGLDSFGRVRPGDVAALREWSLALAGELKELWFLCHFPAEVPTESFVSNRSPQLRDEGPLLDWFGSLPCPVLYLHGHYHHRWIFRSPRAPKVVYLNAGAPTQRSKSADADLGFYRLAGAAAETAIELQTYAPEVRAWSARPVAIPAEPGVSADLQLR